MAQGEITMVTISIETTNDAFSIDYNVRDDGAVMHEVSRILREAVDRDGLRHNLPLLDYNGNTVGVVTVTREGES